MLTIKQITEDTEKVIKGLQKKHFNNAKETIEKVLEKNDVRRKTQTVLDLPDKAFGGHNYIDCLYFKQSSQFFDIESTYYLWTLPDPSPSASFLTSSILTLLKSPSIVCLRQLAATANSSASLSSPSSLSP